MSYFVVQSLLHEDVHALHLQALELHCALVPLHSLQLRLELPQVKPELSDCLLGPCHLLLLRAQVFLNP